METADVAMGVMGHTAVFFNETVMVNRDACAGEIFKAGLKL